MESVVRGRRMSEIEELQKRIEHLETEVGLLKELIKLQDKCQRGMMSMSR